MDSNNPEKMPYLNIDCPASIRDYNDNFTIENIIQRILTEDRQYDMSKIISAYQFAEEYHRGQTRTSGQPYIVHPLAVADIVIDLGLDTDSICASLLHDVIEDTPATFNDLKKRFGHDVAMLVDGVTKMSRIAEKTKNEQQAENILKILLAMAQDIRVIFIKLSDRLHNMRTLKYCSVEKQKRIAYETMSIYVPLANRLGLNAMKAPLEDLAFYYLDPIGYMDVDRLLEIGKKEREEFISGIITKIEERLNQMNFMQKPEVTGRVKSHYGIYRKIFMKEKTIDEIYDKYAIRIIVSTKIECFSVLGLVHDMFTPVTSRLKDYINKPKENMYQSLHTTVLSNEGIPFEVQIRTWEMHQKAEYGMAAHWKYKEGIKGKDKMEQNLAWVRKLIETQKTSDDVEEIVNIIKNDLSPENVVVMTPKGLLVSLPAGANIIDFAYKIHTAVGHKATGGKVNGKMVPLDYELQTNDICEVITCKDENKGPSRDWLRIAKTGEAKAKIRLWFKKQRREENIIAGRLQLNGELRKNKINIPDSEHEEFMNEFFSKYNCNNLDDFYASIGYGGISLVKIVPRLKDKYEKQINKDEKNDEIIPLIKPKNIEQNKITLDDVNGLQYKFAHCCNPLPGDEIVGYITRGYGLSVHTTKCTNYTSVLKRNNPEELERWCAVEWTNKSIEQLQTSFEVISTDRIGLMHDVAEVLFESRIFINHSVSRTLKNGNAIVECTVTISNTEQLKHAFGKLRKIKGVISVERSNI